MKTDNEVTVREVEENTIMELCRE